MMSNQIPGVPEGWEVEHVSRIGDAGEHCVGPYGEPHLLQGRTACRVCIIRKIEKPAKYRPFANAEEFRPHRDRWVKLTVAESDGVYYTFRVVSYDDWGVVFGGSKETYQAVLSRYVFDDDGTPFGVRIDE